jgi:hypothetical protein
VKIASVISEFTSVAGEFMKVPAKFTTVAGQIIKVSG